MIRELDFSGDEEEEEVEDQALVQRRRKMRTLESSKEAEAEVSTKRT